MAGWVEVGESDRSEGWPSEKACIETGDEAKHWGSGCWTAEARAGRDILGGGAKDSAVSQIGGEEGQS